MRNLPVIKTQNNKTSRGLYWIPSNLKNNTGLNDYQYIKSKWLFEIFIGMTSPLNKDYGFILNHSSLNKPHIHSSNVIRHPLTKKILINKKNIVTTLSHSYKLFGGSSNVYHSVLKYSN